METGANRGLFGDGHISNLEGLEKFVKENGKEKNGVYVWNGGFKLRVNSRGEEVNPSCYKLQGYKTYEEWFASMNVEIVNLVK